ncbi:MAG: NAD(P)H-binding protein [Polaromonas sp.]
MSRILVVGSSGTVGSALTGLLAAQGHEVRRATSGAVSESGQVKLNLLTGDGLQAAFEGVHAAFLLAPPGHTNQDALLAPLIEQAKTSGVSKVVLMSAMGANADDNAPLRKAELHLECSGLTWNVIRPNWFMQNFNTFWLHGIQQQGQIFVPLGKAKGSFIDARDIAAVAAKLLTSSQFDNAAFDLTGCEAFDHDQVAAILSKAAGRAIGYTDISPDAMREGLLGAGLPADYAEFLLLILSFFKLGYSERTTDAVLRITGAEPRSLAQYAQDYQAVWK